VAQSPEYPDLRWMPSKSWTNANRTAVQLIVIHTTEGSSRGESAEDGAAYDQRRTDGTSTHYFHDNDSTVQCVRTEDQAHAARTQGNRRGIQHELCGRAGSLDWQSPYAQAMLARAAKQAARDAKKWGIPVRHLSVAQVADGAKGFCGHVDVTRAFPQDNGTHTDPGPNFPWSEFLDMVRDELNPQEADVALADDLITITDDTAAEIGKKAGDKVAASTLLQLALIHAHRSAVDAANADTRARALETAVAGLRTVVLQLVAKDVVDEQALVAMLAPAVATQVIAALPAGADQVSQEEVNAAVSTAFRNAFSGA